MLITLLRTFSIRFVTGFLFPGSLGLGRNLIRNSHKFSPLLLMLGLAAGSFFLSGQTGLASTNALSIVLSDNQVVLSWPATVTNYVLQTATNLPATAWNPVSNTVAVVNGYATVTNSISQPQQFYQLSQVSPPVIPAGMVLIPAGSFTMGDTLDGIPDAVPATNVTVSAFYMDVNLVSSNQWRSVVAGATNYVFDNAGLGQATNQPVQTVSWYDVVKWCNARSQQAGLTPVYYTDAGLTQIYTNGDIDAVYPNWGANGYRLPTEAEWEKAARGGLSGQRFPWGNIINESLANYLGSTSSYSYDSGPTGYNSIGISNGSQPYTSPVGSFAANGYGLYDMAGNLYEWCWDWYDPSPFPAGSAYLGGTDPRGPASGYFGYRVLRSGPWNGTAGSSRCAARSFSTPNSPNGSIGFRCVIGL